MNCNGTRENYEKNSYRNLLELDVSISDANSEDTGAASIRTALEPRINPNLRTSAIFSVR